MKSAIVIELGSGANIMRSTIRDKLQRTPIHINLGTAGVFNRVIGKVSMTYVVYEIFGSFPDFIPMDGNLTRKISCVVIIVSKLSSPSLSLLLPVSNLES
jgi:hypothetical protein